MQNDGLAQGCLGPRGSCRSFKVGGSRSRRTSIISTPATILEDGSMGVFSSKGLRALDTFLVKPAKLACQE